MPEWISNFRLRIKAALRRRELDRDLEEEMRFHLALAKSRHEARGRAADEARAAAQREFGNVTRFQEVCRDMWTFVAFENLWQDLRFASRMLAKQPGFTAMAILSLGLGIGANTAVFTLMNDLLLKDLPVDDPEHLVAIGNGESIGVMVGLSGKIDIFPYDFFRGVESQREPFRGTAAYGTFTVRVATRQGGASAGPAEQAFGQLVSGNFFHVVGAHTIAGRAIEPSDDAEPGRGTVVVISYDYWQRRFAGDPGAIGRTIVMNQTPLTVIGVAQPRFYGVALESSPPDMWLPLTMQPQVMQQHSFLTPGGPYWLHMVGRLRPGVSMAQAQEWMTLRMQRYMLQAEGTSIATDRREDIAKSSVELIQGGHGVSTIRGRYAGAVVALMGNVVLVLLIACANLANYFLAKMATREREITTRLALGAATSRIVRQMLTEAMMLSLIGGCLGILLAAWGTRALIAFVGSWGERTPFDPTPDGAVLAFTAGLSFLTGLSFGLVPAWRATRMNLAPGLKSSSRSSAGENVRLSRFPISKILLTAQVAFSLVLLMGAGLFVGTLRNLENQSFGFNPGHVLFAEIDPRLAGYKPDQLPALYQRLLAELSAQPGVQSLSISHTPPIWRGSWTMPIWVKGHITQPHEDLDSSINSVTPGYFQTAGIRLSTGRLFGPHDGSGSARVVVVNQTMAKHFFPGADPLGKHVFVGEAARGDWEIVGVVEDGKYTGPRDEPTPMVFLPVLQLQGEDLFTHTVLIRTLADPAGAKEALRRVLAQVDPNLPPLRMETLNELVDQSVAREQMVSRLSTFFSLLALLLACIGLYGVMSYSVVRRANEIGIRMALGAQRNGVLWLVLRETLVLLGLGIGLGVPAALAAMQYIRSQLFGVGPFDPPTLALAISVILLVTVIAGYLPARRATGMDPLAALRYE
jgi:predicted permease